MSRLLLHGSYFYENREGEKHQLLSRKDKLVLPVSNYPSSGHLGAVVGITFQHEGKIGLGASGHVGVGPCVGRIGAAPAVESSLPTSLNAKRQIVWMQFPLVFVARDIANLQYESSIEDFSDASYCIYLFFL